MNGRKYCPWLDWLRFSAAIAVLAVHTRSTFLVNYGNLPEGQKHPIVAVFFALSRLGNEAVITFFVLSGFLVGGKGSSRIATSTFIVGDYIVDRVTRIYVPLIPALLLSYACAALNGESDSLACFIGNVLAMQGITCGTFAHNDPLWSISYEIWFYILFGSICALLKFKNSSALKVCVSSTLVLIAMVVFTVLSSTYLYCWIIGCLAYQVRTIHRLQVAATIILCTYAVVGMQCVATTVSVEVVGLRSIFPSYKALQLILSSGIAVGIVWLSRNDSQVRDSNRLTNWGSHLAGFSYSLYLTHYPVLHLLEKQLLPKSNSIGAEMAFSMLTGFAICLIAAIAMYLLFERNTIRVKHLAYRYAGRMRTLYR